MKPPSLWAPARSGLEAVWGPAWPLLLLILAFPGGLALMFAAASRHDATLVQGLFSTLGVGGAALALCVTAWAVHRQARVQRIWSSRLAPLSAARRVTTAVGHGLMVAWAVTALPLLLLGAAQGHIGNALAGAGLLAALMLITAAWASAWQGRLPWLALSPGALVGVAALAIGPQTLWAAWTACPWQMHALAMLVGVAGLPPLLAARTRRSSVVPALVWAQQWARWQRMWRRDYRRVLERGDPGAPPWWVGGFAYPSLGAIDLTQTLGVTGWDAIAAAVGSTLMAAVFFTLTYQNLFSADLHWRQWLAPRGQLRRALGLRVLAHSLAAHGRVGCALMLLVAGVVALWPWGDRLSNLQSASQVAAAWCLYWLLALPAAVWLRGWKARPSQGLLLSVGIVLMWLVMGAALAMAGITQRGPMLLGLVVLSGMVMLPAIHAAWRDRDLADFMTRPADASGTSS